MPSLPDTLRTRQLSLVATGVVSVLVLLGWAAVAGVLGLLRNDALEAEVRQNTNIARALEEQTLRVLSATDQATRRVRDAVVTDAGRLPNLVAAANETGLVPSILVQLTVIDAAGRMRASNLDPDGSKTDHVDLSEREHVRVHLRPDLVQPDTPPLSTDGLFIGKPVLGKVSKKWTIQISRAIPGPDGKAAGVVVASLDPGYFESVFGRVVLGSQGSVALAGSDRVVRARVVGGKPAGMGSKLSESSPSAGTNGPAEGWYEAASGVDRVPRMIAFRRVASYPLYVMVATDFVEALAPWASTRNIALVLTALLTVATLGAMLLIRASLTRLEQAHAALMRSESEAQAANQSKTEFLAAISHELRTPLTSIRGFAELMEMRLDNPKYRETAGLIRKGAEHLNKLVSEILDLAKTEAGAMVLSPTRVELHPLVREAVDFFSVAAQSKGLALQMGIAPDVPQVVHCDGLRLKQILNNLLSNAVKFTPAGSAMVDVRRKGEQVLFSVKDTGPGVPPEVQELIFEKFRQGSAKVSYEHGGTGLGLALSRSLAGLMQGTLTVHSVPGEGATFTLAVPLPTVD